MKGHSRVRLPVFTAAAPLDLFLRQQKARGDGLTRGQVPGHPQDAIGATHLGALFVFPQCVPAFAGREAGAALHISKQWWQAIRQDCRL